MRLELFKRPLAIGRARASERENDRPHLLYYIRLIRAHTGLLRDFDVGMALPTISSVLLIGTNGVKRQAEEARETTSMCRHVSHGATTKEQEMEARSSLALKRTHSIGPACGQQYTAWRDGLCVLISIVAM